MIFLVFEMDESINTQNLIARGEIRLKSKSTQLIRIEDFLKSFWHHYYDFGMIFDGVNDNFKQIILKTCFWCN